jgi:uncharacterized membrane protein YqaE (UPF0057 family)
MKTIFTKGVLAIAIVALASSCSTTNDVASNRGIQKRKYNKGFFVSKNPKSFNKKHDVENTKDINSFDEVTEVINSQTKSKNITTKEKVIANNKKIAATENTVKTTSNEKKNTIENSLKSSKNNDEIFEENEINNNITKKDVKSKLKSKKHKTKNTGGDVDLVVLVLLAIFLPPLAVFLYEGITTRFWINLVLTLLLITALIAVIHALLIVTGTI